MTNNPMAEITFWKLNRKRIVVLFIALAATCCFLFFMDSIQNIYGIIILFLGLTCFIIIFPTIICFKVMKNMISDTSEYSLLPLFDSGYTIGIQNENTWLIFATPCINATINGLPVEIYYTPADKGNWAHLSCDFTPLIKENNKRIFVRHISFRMFLKRKLTKDVKPEILKFVSDIKAEGYCSGAGRKTHIGAYE
ncbi:MAG: hypothetical protein JSS96_03915 [Bacteroidetes bacterium]|nr:hypothetical protein [Bacteroidota bacterium]